jgi:uncharacterized protein YndB with AHSA1/START domain
MAIKFELVISAPAKKIFNAITTQKGYQGWWAKVCDVDCRPDGVSSIRFEKEKVVEEMVFKVIELIPNEKLVWLCTSNNVFESWVNSTIVFEIAHKGQNSLVRFIQTSPIAFWEKHPDYSGSVAGWEFFMESLKAYCETGKGSPWG